MNLLPLPGARSNTAADWQSGDRSASRQNQRCSALIRLIATFGCKFKGPPQVREPYFTWIPLLHAQKKSSTLDAVVRGALLLWLWASVKAHKTLFLFGLSQISVMIWVRCNKSCSALISYFMGSTRRASK